MVSNFRNETYDLRKIVNKIVRDWFSIEDQENIKISSAWIKKCIKNKIKFVEVTYDFIDANSKDEESVYFESSVKNDINLDKYLSLGLKMKYKGIKIILGINQITFRYLV